MLIRLSGGEAIGGVTTTNPAKNERMSLLNRCAASPHGAAVLYMSLDVGSMDAS